jgi:hypothetical protein
MPRQYVLLMIVLLWCRAVTILRRPSPPLARLLIGSPETVLSALIECYE